MIIFILMAIKIVTSIFLVSNPQLLSVSIMSIPMLLGHILVLLDTEPFVEKTGLYVILLAVCLLLVFLMWIITPWLIISKKSVVAITGITFAIGLNLFDIIACLLSALSIFEKIANISFSVSIILLGIMVIRKNTVDR